MLGKVLKTTLPYLECAASACSAQQIAFVQATLYYLIDLVCSVVASEFCLTHLTRSRTLLCRPLGGSYAPDNI